MQGMNDLVKRCDVFVYLTEYYNHRTELQHDALKQALSRVPSAEPDYKTDHGYMWICPRCGLVVHSDYNKCVRCGYER